MATASSPAQIQIWIPTRKQNLLRLLGRFVAKSAPPLSRPHWARPSGAHGPSLPANRSFPSAPLLVFPQKEGKNG